MDVKLVVETGEREGHEISIDAEEFVLGRDRSCQRRIIHHQVSPRHCRILRDGARVWVEDLDSATGTEVNGRPIETAEVRHGDRLKVGSECFRIAIAAEADDAIKPNRSRCIAEGWAKLRVIESRGIAFVGFTNIALIHDMEIREVGRELDDLIGRGHNRIALDFENVVRLSSQIISLVLKAHRCCTADGGTVKICRIHPDLREIFALTGVFLTIDIYPDVRSTLESEWPQPSPRRPSPAAPLAPPQENGQGVPRPRHGGGDEALRRARETPADRPDPTIPLDDLFLPPLEDTASLRPSPAARPTTSQEDGVDVTSPRRGVEDEARPKLLATPQDDFLIPWLEDTASLRPSPAARPTTSREDGVDVTTPRRGVEDEARPTPWPPDDLDPAIPLDDSSTPPEQVAPAPSPSLQARPAAPRTNGVDATHPRCGAGADVRPTPGVAPRDGTVEAPGRPGGAARRVRLIVQVGRAQGQAVAVPAPRFLIGRDPRCHLRPVSPIVSPFHALIEHRGGRVFLRDLGSANGTELEGRTLERFEEVEVADGQWLQVGPMRFTVAIDPVAAPSPAVAAIPPTGPGPISSAPPGVLSRDSHLRPLIQCPRCGIDGWFSVDQLLLAIGHTLTSPPATAAPSPLAPVPPGHSASSPVQNVHLAHRNGHALAGPRTGHAASPAATPPHGAANGWGHGRVGVPA
jgi:pSer/pThr/pTyr-binding forkhead associated (FHA) protein